MSEDTEQPGTNFAAGTPEAAPPAPVEPPATPVEATPVEG